MLTPINQLSRRIERVRRIIFLFKCHLSGILIT
jgi:hypothetical protein